MRKSQAWSLVVAFHEEASPGQATDDVALQVRTLEAIGVAADLSQALVLTAVPQLADRAQQLGAHVEQPGRDLNGDITHAVQFWAQHAPHRSCAVIVGPLPMAEGSDIADALRACAATESALIEAQDAGTAFLTHADPSRLTPRFGGASAARHRRAAVSVGLNLTPVRVRTPQPTAPTSPPPGTSKAR